MSKNLFSSLLIFSFFIGLFSAQGQTATIDTLPGTSGSIVVGSTSNYHVSENLYYNSEIGTSNFITAGTAINSVEFSVANVGTPTTFTNVKIYMMNVPLATTTLAASNYSISGYTLVYSGSFLAPSSGWAGVQLTTPFTRSVGTNLQVMIERQDNATHIGYVFNSSNVSLANNSRRYNGAAALVSGTTALAVSTARAAIRLKHIVVNDAAVSQVYTFGKFPVGSVTPHSITALITNKGVNVLTAVPVTVSVTGANTFSNTQTIPSLAPGASATVSFPGYNPTILGNNIVTVTVPTDDDNSNNSSFFLQIVTNNTIAYSNNDAATGSVGYNTGAGCVLTKYRLNQATTLLSVRVFLSSSTTNTGNVVYGVLLSETGTLIAQTLPYSILASDLGTYKAFTFTVPQTLAANTNYMIGLAQTANVLAGYSPVGTQSETIGRPAAYYFAPLAGGTPTEYTTLGRFMIEGIIRNTTLPVTLSDFSGKWLSNKSNLLTWTTATESNNKGFELERSADSKNFSVISFVNSRSENGNSSNSLKYEFTDENALSSTNYYRLKQLDKDGKFTYSDIVAIKGAKLAALEFSVIYPNPVKDKLNIVLSSPKASDVTIVIVDAAGNTVLQQAVHTIEGSNNLPLNVKALKAGNYIIKAICGEGCETTMKKFVKE